MELVENSNTMVIPVVEQNLNSGQRIDLCDRTFECELSTDVLHVVSAKKNVAMTVRAGKKIGKVL